MDIHLGKRAVRQIRLSAQDAIDEGDTETLREDVGRAIEGFERAEMRLHAAAVRRRLGALQGGDEGRALEHAGATFMTEQTIRHAAQVTELLAPALAP